MTEFDAHRSFTRGDKSRVVATTDETERERERELTDGQHARDRI